MRLYPQERLLSETAALPHRTEPQLQPARGVSHVRDRLPRDVARGSPSTGEQFPVRTRGERLDKRPRAAGCKLAKQFRDGTCQVNCHNSIAYGLPYGGQGISGGLGGGVNCEETFLDYTQVKAVYVADYPSS